MARQHASLESATCPFCGKQTFTNRKSAKTAMRRAHPNDKMSIYKCRKGPSGMTDRWHYGHLADPIKQGIVDRDTVYSGQYRSMTTDKKDTLTMPTIAEMANIKHLMQNQGIPEPTAPALVQAQFAYHALVEHVKSSHSGFERYNQDGIDGWIGPLALKPFLEDLIPPKAGWDSHQSHARSRAVSEMLNRHKVVICMDHSGKLQGVKPTYFVAANGSVLDRLVPGKAIDPAPAPETPVKKAVQKSSKRSTGGAYTRGYEILHKSVEKILKNAYDNHGIAVLGHELYDLVDFSGIEKTGREKPSAGGFYTWMRDRAARGEFSFRMETDAELAARPNPQGGRKTYYYAPAGVEVPSMTHGETLAIYMAEAFAPNPAPCAQDMVSAGPEVPTPVVAAVPEEEIQSALDILGVQNTSSTNDPHPEIINSLADSIKALNDSRRVDSENLYKVVHYMSMALAALTNGSDV